jgi:hypothetical protein
LGREGRGGVGIRGWGVCRRGKSVEGIWDRRCGLTKRRHERGPAKVRDEAMRIQIPKEKVVETGRPAATA